MNTAKTLPDSTVEGRKGFETSLINLKWYESPDRLIVQVVETNHLGDLKVDNAVANYIFDRNFKLQSIGSSDVYDEYAREIYESGQTDILADGKYLETFKDSLLYWNGESFQHEPTMNKEYLRAVGESTDSK